MTAIVPISDALKNSVERGLGYQCCTDSDFIGFVIPDHSSSFLRQVHDVK